MKIIALHSAEDGDETVPRFFVVDRISSVSGVPSGAKEFYPEANALIDCDMALHVKEPVEVILALMKQATMTNSPFEIFSANSEE